MFLLTFRKIRKRDKSDIGVSTSSLNTQTTNYNNSSNINNNNNNNNNNINKSNLTANTQQPVKLKSKKNNSNETISFNISNNNNTNRKNKNSSSYKDLNLDFTDSSGTTGSGLVAGGGSAAVNNKQKSSTLPLDKSNSYSLNSNHTTDLSSYASIVNTTKATLNKNRESILTLDDDEYINDDINNRFKSHKSDMSTSNTTGKQSTQSLAATQQSSSLNVSTSYLDENNLKLAIIDYSDILKLIKLQNSIEYQEWLAFNTKMYFDQINVLYGAIVDHCTLQTCPTMNAPLNTQFYWLDDKNKKIKYSASQYIDTVLTYIAKIISDEVSFPTKCGHPFPANFDSLVKKIHKYLFHILAHMYHSHYRELSLLKLHTYVNSIYLHFYTFNKTFNILDEKEIEIMDALNKSFLAKYSTTSTQQLATSLMQNQQQQPTIHQNQSSNTASSSSSSSGFSFFKKKLNFNLMT